MFPNTVASPASLFVLIEFFPLGKMTFRNIYRSWSAAKASDMWNSVRKWHPWTLTKLQSERHSSWNRESKQRLDITNGTIFPVHPTSQPSEHLTSQPSEHPTSRPSEHPTSQPSEHSLNTAFAGKSSTGNTERPRLRPC